MRASKVIYDPDRLKQPLIRVGERGGGRWRQATWKEALDFTAEGLLKVRAHVRPAGRAVQLVASRSRNGSSASFAQAFGLAEPRATSEHVPQLGQPGVVLTYGTVPEFDVWRTPIT